MITRLQKSHYLDSSWKNGAGQTKQIAIYPTDSTVAANNFLWRISSATVNNKNSFSQFSGYERILLVLSGEGLILNGTPLLPFEPLEFSGDQAIECGLINELPVIDLGIIYNKFKIRAQMEVIDVGAYANIHLGIGLHFLFFDSLEGFRADLDNECDLLLENIVAQKVILISLSTIL